MTKGPQAFSISGLALGSRWAESSAPGKLAGEWLVLPLRCHGADVQVSPPPCPRADRCCARSFVDTLQQMKVAFILNLQSVLCMRLC